VTMNHHVKGAAKRPQGPLHVAFADSGNMLRKTAPPPRLLAP
jgi:hypothetical protein